MLALESIKKQFGDVKAVDAVNLAVSPGQMVGIIGRSGAGKSTLLRLINRLIDPDAGRITFNGTDVTALRGRPLRSWRARCAMIFQGFNLVDRLDVLTNVLVGRLGYHHTLPSLIKHFSKTEKAMAVQALEQLDMVETALQRADTLSGGQQQRVAIARALVQEPELILADEPIASLDPHNAAKVMDALKTINTDYGITVICNLHHIETAREYCDRIIGMRAGRLIFDAPPPRLTRSEVSEIYGIEGEASDEAAAPSIHPGADVAFPKSACA